MYEIKVTSCMDCPFRVTMYDDFTVGEAMDVCGLKRFHGEYYTLKSYRFVDEVDYETPEWCSLTELKIRRVGCGLCFPQGDEG